MNEKDIEILKEFIIKFYESYKPHTLIYNPEIEAIKNIINRNQLLEERDKANRKVIREYSDCIPKTKIREKIKVKEDNKREVLI